MWQQWLNLILALWIILSGYMNFTPSAMTTSVTISGIAIAILALWGALSYRSHEESYGREHSHA